MRQIQHQMSVLKRSWMKRKRQVQTTRVVKRLSAITVSLHDKAIQQTQTDSAAAGSRGVAMKASVELARLKLLPDEVWPLEWGTTKHSVVASSLS